MSDRGAGAQYSREDIAALVAAWAHLPEGHIDAPMLMVPLTPAATLLMMDTFGMDTIDVDVAFADPPPVRAAQMVRPPSYEGIVAPGWYGHPFRGRVPDDCETCGRPAQTSIHQQGAVAGRTVHAGPR